MAMTLRAVSLARLLRRSGQRRLRARLLELEGGVLAGPSPHCHSGEVLGSRVPSL
ncbi:MAG: hypothetical protein K6E40_02490 [Desulfovibrio sp.]|nr:hypothetical protein [Desulfovibrio sp.]